MDILRTCFVQFVDIIGACLMIYSMVPGNLFIVIQAFPEIDEILIDDSEIP
jgi:hypothetical protein